MAHSPAFSFYSADFIMGTATFSLSERGAYIVLLAHQWDKGSIPDDVTERARLLGVSVKRADAIWERIRDKFQQMTDGTWKNTRLERERLKQAQRRESLAQNGRKGGRPSKEQDENQKVNQTETNRFTEQKPSDNQKKSLSSSSSSSFSRDLSITPDSVPSTDLARRAKDLIERYSDLYPKHRHGARLRLVSNSLQFQDAISLVSQWTDERLDKLAQIVLTTDDEWVSRTDRSFRIFAARASWADDKLCEWEAKQKVGA